MTIRFKFSRRRAWLALALPAAAVSLAACVVEPARPPQPAPLVEVVPVAPAPGYHWVRGHYAWRHDRWEWVRGHWVLD
ncbi:hypothetical protein C0Z18_23230 [Trinickia dabaoshanensis]|uniref:YXWGXW repeat-containing protein n=1 Tax=Trinickia dabaoshanensis TaxID=564714 RepID=A0A2N7VH55_9BURK|nr:YXWGXW repeat-containing protein [Trinickia dabaoshanensis]PMS16480.1 hypothetical protein C0Z18_23230 [Trinickia dabaoshanensis]